MKVFPIDVYREERDWGLFECLLPPLDFETPHFNPLKKARKSLKLSLKNAY